MLVPVVVSNEARCGFLTSPISELNKQAVGVFVNFIRFEWKCIAVHSHIFILPPRIRCMKGLFYKSVHSFADTPSIVDLFRSLDIDDE